jgi:peptidoglycan/LPS O-acetylase OafA/YrhL
MGHHCAVVPQDAGWLSPFALAWYRVGWTGVDLFFVLSGYLIGGLLLDELRSTERICVSRFLARRALKIWPPLLVYLAFLGATMVGGLGDEPQEVRQVGVPLLARYVLALQNYVGPLSARSAHTWSLAVEEHFYLALPLALAVFGARAVPRLAALVLIACPLVRCWANWGRPFHYLTHQFPTHLRADSLLFGVLLAYAERFRPRVLDWLRSRRTKLAMAGLTLISPAVVLDLGPSPFIYTIGYTLIYLGYGALLVAAGATQLGTGMVGRPLAVVGVHSYSVYLWHAEPLRFVRASFGGGSAITWLGATAAYVVLATAAGVLMARGVEGPMLALRDRTCPRVPRRPRTAADDGEKMGSVRRTS